MTTTTEPTMEVCTDDELEKKLEASIEEAPKAEAPKKKKKRSAPKSGEPKVARPFARLAEATLKTRHDKLFTRSEKYRVMYENAMRCYAPYKYETECRKKAEAVKKVKKVKKEESSSEEEVETSD